MRGMAVLGSYTVCTPRVYLRVQRIPYSESRYVDVDRGSWRHVAVPVGPRLYRATPRNPQMPQPGTSRYCHGPRSPPGAPSQTLAAPGAGRGFNGITRASRGRRSSDINLCAVHSGRPECPSPALHVTI